MSRKSYSDELKDPRWQKKRLEILNRDEFTCQMCSDSESTLHVHHKRYIKGVKPWDYASHDLATVCENCHEEAHELMEKSAALMSSLTLYGMPTSIQSILPVIAGIAHTDKDALGIDFYGHDPHGYMLGQAALHLMRLPIDDVATLLALVATHHPKDIVRAAAAALGPETGK